LEKLGFLESFSATQIDRKFPRFTPAFFGKTEFFGYRLALPKYIDNKSKDNEHVINDR